MEEVKEFSFTPAAFQIFCRQFIVLLKQNRQIFFCQGIRLCRSYYRLHGNFSTHRDHLQYFSGEFPAEMGVSAPQIVVPAFTAVDDLLKAPYGRIITAALVGERTHGIVHLFAPIQT